MESRSTPAATPEVATVDRLMTRRKAVGKLVYVAPVAVAAAALPQAALARSGKSHRGKGKGKGKGHDKPKGPGKH